MTRSLSFRVARFITLVLIAILVLVFLYFYIATVFVGNPRVMAELQAEPDGQLSGLVGILTLPDESKIPVNYLHEKSKVNATVLPKAIYDAEEELNKLSSDSYVRGKFHLLFLINFYEKSKKALELANGRDIKVHFNMNEYTIVDFLAPRVQIPEKLNQFYQKACPAEFVNA